VATAETRIFCTAVSNMAGSACIGGEFRKFGGVTGPGCCAPTMALSASAKIPTRPT
jgi:hypothetical protein